MPGFSRSLLERQFMQSGRDDEDSFFGELLGWIVALWSLHVAGFQKGIGPHGSMSRCSLAVLVADDAAGEADQDRGEGGQPRPVRHVPDGGGRGAERPVPKNPAADPRAAATTSTDMNRGVAERQRPSKGGVCLGGGKFPVPGFSEGNGWPSWSSRSAMAPNRCLSAVNLAWSSLDLEPNGKYQTK